ncbi:hypothetical protein F9362_20210 [Escherichia coli]|uniref:hypothetical protein n=1 Tax=Enterobacteriaceae TaxID=543 RepID=UPI000BE47E63|nr:MULTISPECIES: hypothetical protein [Enterobacteriaceae]EFH4048051.1 hypothetical protein [Escherichia coli]EFJ8049090.1 hypothetical protein [Escherichia coli]EFN8929381.1 hypothetical protein [Escherichia coli]ELN3541378.1 hypothetical protein [Escherichia coli]ELN3546389.1 hypothetical protein [Escherichia coli]
MIRKIYAVLFFAFIGLSSSAYAINYSETIFGKTATIKASNYGELAETISDTNKNGGAIIISPDVPRGPMPVKPNDNTRIVDLRYNGGIDIVRGNHPRLEGMWPQYSNLGTGLGKNFVLSDVVPYDAKVESWKGEPVKAHADNPNRAQDSHEYSNSHNHYQNFLSEVWTFSPTVNGVAIWGDSGAFYPGAKTWGGFLSARSWPVHWEQYVPEGTPSFDDKDFDAQLVGLEIDVLNGGLPNGQVSEKIGRPLSKSGLQIVGFGNTNTAAIELRSEDSDDMSKKPGERKGTWHYGIIAYNSLNPDSTLIYSATPAGKTGIDFEQTHYSDSAIKINSEGPKTGISFTHYDGGQIYSKGRELFIQPGQEGLTIAAPNGDAVWRFGVGGSVWFKGFNMTKVGIPIIAILLIIFVFMLLQIISQRKQLAEIKQLIKR